MRVCKRRTESVGARLLLTNTRMAILQALIALISRSAGTILNAVFGWAVRALFGQPSQAEQPYLTGIVGSAAAWPILLLGIAFPKVAAMVLAFVPFHNRIPPWVFRIVWLSLAILVPIVVGLVVATKAPPGSLREPVWKRIARGWPITIGLAASFLLMFITVPALKLVSFVRRRSDEQVPLVTNSATYHEVAELIVQTLDRHDMELQRAVPGWWITAPTAILLKLGGQAFRGYVPDQLEYFRSATLEVALYPNGLLLRGPKRQVARAHALVSEGLSHSQALQTLDTKAQDLEQRIHSLWAQFDRDPVGLVGSEPMLKALSTLARDLSTSQLPFEDWQVVYRELLQLDRELRGQPQLIDGQRTLHDLHEKQQAAH